MLNRRLNQISGEYLRDQVASGLHEGRGIEFKEAFPDRGVRFLRTVSAFANSSGGDVIFGIDDAGALVGLPLADLPAAQDRLQNMLNNGLEPRHSAVQFHQVDIGGNLGVLVARVPRSLIGPHVVNTEGHWRFYVRTEAVTAEMDIGQLRDAFATSGGYEATISRLRLARIARITEGDTPVEMEPWDGGIAALHIFALESGSGRRLISLPDIDVQFDQRFAPIGGNFRSTKYDLEGYVRSQTQYHGNEFNAYCMLSRFGWIESVFGLLPDQGEKKFPADWVWQIVESIRKYVFVLADLGLRPPWVLSLSILNSQGMTIRSPIDRFFDGRNDPIRKNELIIPEITLLDTPGDATFADSMKPLFDMVWNAFGAAEIPSALLRQPARRAGL